MLPHPQCRDDEGETPADIFNVGFHPLSGNLDRFYRCQQLRRGNCHSATALCKTQFAGAKFFNGFRWPGDLDLLEIIIHRVQGELCQHLPETEACRDRFFPGDLGRIVSNGGVRVKLKS